jgi:MYXO-CTERM domain-containing protein
MRHALALLLLLAAPAPALANGAFPDSLQLLLPPDRPEKITLATNFGLVFTSDGGATWEWTCEHSSALGAILYQLAPGPRGTIFGVGLDIVRTEDDGCTWKAATGRIATGFLYDVFVDPTNADRVLALANPNDETPTRTHVFESLDGGSTFPTSLYQGESGTDLSGLETAFSDPSTFYVTWSSSKTGELRSGLIRVDAAGPHNFDHFDALGGNPLGIAAVDRKDPHRIFLRVFGNPKDRLAVSDDGGATVRVALEATTLAGFLQRADGTLLVAARDLDEGTLYVSRDAGRTFTVLMRGPRFRALAERGGRLYAAADDIADGWALGVSDDGGLTWKPLLRFLDIKGLKSCGGTDLKAACMTSCVRLAGIGTLRPDVCGFIPSDAGAADAPARGPDAGGPTPSPGCDCGVGGRGAPSAFLVVALATLGLLGRRRLRQLVAYRADPS